MKNDYIIKNDVVIIFLYNRMKTKKYECVIDSSDLVKLELYDVNWYPKFQKNPQKYYASASKNGESIYMTRILMNAPFGTWVDHIDNDTMNNRKKNLRITTNAENLKNRKSKNSNNSSGYRNVSWSKVLGKWVVQLQIDKKNHMFDEKFDDVHEAGRFAKKMRIKYYGEFAGKN
jgi:hypothetical protein